MREPPYERSTARLPWGVKGGARAVGGHTLTNRHSFIAGVKRSRGPRLAICTPEHRLAGVVPFQQGRNIMRHLGVLMTATQKRLLLALTAVTALATATATVPGFCRDLMGRRP